MRIHTVVADAETPARDRLIRLLSSENDVLVVGAASNGLEAVEMTRLHRPQLLFLDIQMPVLDGFGALARIERSEMPLTIFVTAYETYAVRAFEIQALDYLLKPFSHERLKMALERARHQLIA